MDFRAMGVKRAFRRLSRLFSISRYDLLRTLQLSRSRGTERQNALGQLVHSTNLSQIMNFYHGTDKTAGDGIQKLKVPIDPTKGGGELGQGFYLGDNLTLAIAWAKGRFANPAVLEFDVKNSSYATLSFKQMGHHAVLKSWRRLKKLGTSRSHTFGVDVVFGPLATASYAAQYKFETLSATLLLDSSSINRII